MSTGNPAYKEVWFWAVFSPLLLVMAVCAVLIRFAVVGGDDVVIDDYYKEGRMINNRFEAEHNAKTLDIAGQAKFEESSNLMQLTLFGKELPGEVTMTLSHPAERDLDKVIVLKRKGEHLYTAELTPQPRGRYYVLIESDGYDANSHWRIGGEINFDANDFTSFGSELPTAIESLN